MSIEIRELVIRASVSDPVDHRRDPVDRRDRPLSPREMDRIVAACVRQLMTTWRTSRER